jgi:hypothetical protein
MLQALPHFSAIKFVSIGKLFDKRGTQYLRDNESIELDMSDNLLHNCFK